MSVLRHDNLGRFCSSSRPPVRKRYTATGFAATESLECRVLLSATQPLATATSSEPNAHYESLLADPALHAAFDLRDPTGEQYRQYANGSYPTGQVAYDPAFDAARITIPDDASSLSMQDYMRLPFDPLTKGVDQEVSIQWEARWSKEYLDATSFGLHTHKSFRLDNDGAPGGDSRRFELQARYSIGGDAAALPTIRSYYGINGGDGKNDPLSSGGDKQPGGQGEAFLIAPDTWVRFTLSITWHDGEQRIRLWMADENTDPVLVIADPDDPTKGFLSDAGPETVVGLDQFVVLFNTSQTLSAHPPLVSHVRNVVVFKDATVPLGGRPGEGDGTEGGNDPGIPPEPEPEPQPTVAHRFDFGTRVSPVADGYTQVVRSTRYIDGGGQSYGWLNDVRMYDRGIGNARISDFHYSRAGTFVVDVADGVYDVTLALGDTGALRDYIAVSLEGRQVDLVSTGKGHIHTAVYRVEVSDGQLTLGLVDRGGRSSTFAVNYLNIDTVSQAAAGVYYVSTTGSDATSGTRQSPFRTIDHALSTVRPGDTIVVLPGTYSESLATRVAGTADQRIIIKAETNGTVVVQGPGNVLDVEHPFYTFEGIVFDGAYGAGDVISVSANGDALHLLAAEVRNGRRDGIDVAGADDILIKDSKIHSLLWFEAGTQHDAHGVVSIGGKNLTIRGTEIYYVSGDGLQLQYGGWDNALVESSHFWNGPLPAGLAANFGAPTGARLGENAIDTKQYGDVPAGNLIVRRSVFNGWHSDYISNAAALNLKHNVDVTVDANTFYDNEIALRLRGPGALPGARVLVTNNVFHSNPIVIRYEDGIEGLRIHNNTFGDGNGRFFQSAGGHGVGFSVLNNLFFAPSLPGEASDASNLAVGASAFVNPAAHDYHLASNSPAIDAGIDVPTVTTDRDGQQRPVNGAFDVGAFEAALEGVFSAGDDSLLLTNSL